MSNKSSMGSFDLNEFKEKMQEVKSAVAQAKVNYEVSGRNAEVQNQSFVQQAIGILIIVGLLVLTGWALISNIDLMFLPKNSITIVVENESGEYIEGVTINLNNMEGAYDHIHTDVNNLTLLDMEPGKYMLTFQEVPEGYEPEIMVDTIELKQNGKVKVEYTCREK